MKKKRWVIERVDTRGDRGKAHRNPGKQEPGNKRERDGKERERKRDNAEGDEHREHDRDRDDTSGCSPEEFAGDHVLDRERRCDDRIEAFLVIHPHVRTVGALKKRGVHRRDGEDRWCDINNIRHAVHQPHVGAESQGRLQRDKAGPSMKGGKKFTFQVLQKTSRLRLQTVTARRLTRGNERRDGILLTQVPPGQF